MRKGNWKHRGKTLLALTLALVSASGMAEWSYVGKTGDAKIYADVDTIRKEGDKVKMWSLWDYSREQTIGRDKSLSLKEQSEYDCKEEQNRSLGSRWYGGNMGAGEPMFKNSEPGEWAAVTPGTVGAGLWKLACEKSPPEMKDSLPSNLQR